MRIKVIQTCAFVALISFLACTDSNVSEHYEPSIMGHYLYISKDNLSYTSEGGTVSAEISTKQTPWGFVEYPAWLNISPSQGNGSSSVSFTASENLSSDTTRTCVFYLKSNDEGWSYRSYISAYQAAASAYLELDKQSLVFTGSASTQVVNVNSNTNYSVSSSDSWVKYKTSFDNKTIEISVEENLTGASRTAVVSLTGSINKSINITQQAADMTGETAEQLFSCDGGTHIISFNSETAWEATTSSSWINVSPENGSAGDNKLSISTVPNSSTSERTDYVYLMIGQQVKLQIPVKQDGIYIRTNVPLISFDSYSCERSLLIESNTDWEILSYPDWASPSESKGKGDKEIIINALENPDVKVRTGVIKIGQKGFSYSIEVVVEQAAMNVGLDKTKIDFNDTASSVSLVLSTEGTWSAYTNDAWIHLSPTSGIGNTNIVVSVDENFEESERNGTVYVSIGNTVKEIAVAQSGKYFSFSNDNLELVSTGGVISLSLKTNEAWTISSDASWISTSLASGSGNADISITVADNPSIKSRKATVTIIPANSQSVVLIITQNARYLKVDHTSLSFFAKGGTSDVITIDTDGKFVITKDQDWLTVNPNGKTFTVTVAPSSLLEPRTANVEVQLSGLANNESYSVVIPVMQKAVSENFTGEDFGEDEDWNF